MVIAGDCLMIDEGDTSTILDCAYALVGHADFYRCKIYGGGPNIEKYKPGIRDGGIWVLEHINNSMLPALTEVRTIEQFDKVIDKISGVWIGARNCQNYDLLEHVSKTNKVVMVKRGAGNTIDEILGIHDLMLKLFNKQIYIIERGINTFDRGEVSRWSPDIKGAMRIKHYRPDVWPYYVVDCSHSVFDKNFVADTYMAFRAIGCENFMFECTIDGKSETDQAHMLSVNELKNIIGEK